MRRLLLLGAGLLAAAPAGAADFELNVTVRVHGADPRIQRATPYCEVMAADGRRLGSGYGPWLELERGGIDTEVRLAFDADAGRDPRDAAYYRCRTELLVPWRSGRRHLPWSGYPYDYEPDYRPYYDVRPPASGRYPQRQREAQPRFEPLPTFEPLGQ